MLKRQQRLKDLRVFRRIYRQGRHVTQEGFILYCLPNQLPYNRLAVVVSTKISKKAAVRNRIRRRLQGVFLQHWPELKTGQDLLVSVKADLSCSASDQLRSEVSAGLEKAGLL